MASERPNIYLCGFMGTGKSSVGKRLAETLGCEFVDMDARIEAEAGTAISAIFAERGESAFREMESRMVERIARRSGCVVATGGGAIVDPKNLEAMKGSGTVVTLTADIPTILRRCGDDATRPLLQTGDRRGRVQSLLEQRGPFYARADIILDTSALDIEEIVAILANRLRPTGHGSWRTASKNPRARRNRNDKKTATD